MGKKLIICMVVFLLAVPIGAGATDTKSGEKEMFGEMKKLIPPDRMKNSDDLYQKWQEVQAGKSKAITIDLRTESEFDSGHIKDSNNIDSGHAYTIPDKWPNHETEMWVFCRTSHRATYFVGQLYKYGYKNVYLVEKGIVGWSEKGYPLVNTYLGEIKVVKYDKKMKETFTYRENK
ncbi:MAG: rhodanese-like domain-containing protein [Nitrospirae bacterium]|nr:MAG: rhodanese-like domain-containing protein [Nitrospirota bacterium]